jgi:hypothetical protein
MVVLIAEKCPGIFIFTRDAERGEFVGVPSTIEHVLVGATRWLRDQLNLISETPSCLLIVNARSVVFRTGGGKVVQSLLRSSA